MKKNNDKLENIKLIIDFQTNAIFQTANLTAKGMAFYLAIFAAIIGYFLTQEIPEETKNVATRVGVAVSCLAAIVGVVILWGISKGLRSIEKNLKELDKELFYKLEVDIFFLRGRRALTIGAICTLTLVLVLSISLLSIL